MTVNIQDGGRYCMDALLSKSADLGNVVEINVAYLGFTGNQDAVVVANVVESTGMAIVARKSSGVRAPADLAGKRFGYTPGTQGDLFAHRFLEKHKIDTKSMEMQKLQPKAIAPAVGARGIDAASSWEPFVNGCLRAMGDDAVVFRDPDAHTGFMHLAARKERAAQNPDTVKRFLRALRKAQQFAADHPEEAQVILAKEMNLDLETTKTIWPYFRLELTMDKMALVGVTERVGNWIQRSQENYGDKPVPDYRVYFTDEYFQGLTDPAK